MLLEPLGQVEEVGPLAPQHTRQRLPHDVGRVLVDAGWLYGAVELVGVLLSGGHDLGEAAAEGIADGVGRGLGQPQADNGGLAPPNVDLVMRSGLGPLLPQVDGFLPPRGDEIVDPVLHVGSGVRGAEQPLVVGLVFSEQQRRLSLAIQEIVAALPRRSRCQSPVLKALSSLRARTSAAGASTRRMASSNTATTWLACTTSTLNSTEELPRGEHQVRMEFAYAGGGLGKGGHVTLYIDGKQVGEGTVPMTQAMVFSADDGCDVGEDSGAPVSPDYGSRGNGFNGTVKGVQLAIEDAAESLGHLVSVEDAVRIAMARQ